MRNTIAIFFVINIGCTSVGVKTTDVHNLDLASYQSYNFNEFNYMRYDSMPYNENIYNYFIQQMNFHMLDKGLELSDDPNLVLNIGVVVRLEEQIEKADDRKYMGQELLNREDRVVGEFDIGDVIINCMDNQNNTLVWRATIETVLSKKEAKMKKKIDKSVAKIFSNFPAQ